MDKKEVAQEVAKKLNWADIVGDPNLLKVEMFWRLYAQNIFANQQVSAIQYKETKQAFFVGFSECFRVMTDISERYSEQDASDIITRLAEESNNYIDSLIDRTLK